VARYADRFRRARGDTLIEALVAILLMAILGFGLAYGASRALNAQRGLAVQSRAIMEMRDYLQNQDDLLCEPGTAMSWTHDIAGKTITFEVTCEQREIEVDGGPVTVWLPTTVATQSSDTSMALFGGDGRVAFTLE